MGSSMTSARLLALLAVLIPSTIAEAGSLYPSGPPAPTMRTMEQ